MKRVPIFGGCAKFAKCYSLRSPSNATTTARRSAPIARTTITTTQLITHQRQSSPLLLIEASRTTRWTMGIADRVAGRNRELETNATTSCAAVLDQL